MFPVTTMAQQWRTVKLPITPSPQGKHQGVPSGLSKVSKYNGLKGSKYDAVNTFSRTPLSLPWKHTTMLTQLETEIDQLFGLKLLKLL